MVRTLREEFRLAKFGLGYHDPDVFVRAQWRSPRWAYPAWRCFWFLWHLGWIIASGVNTHKNKARYPGEGVKWFIYVTNTTLLLTTITCTVDFIIVLYLNLTGDGTVLGLSKVVPQEDAIDDSASAHSAKEKDEVLFHAEFTVENGLKEHTTPWYVKLLWCLYSIISSSNILVTVLYWAVVYNGSTDAVGVVVHTINAVFIILNLLYSAMPVQILHFIYPMAYAALYVLFNFIYLEAGGTDLRGRDYIYSALDWSKAHPTAAAVIVGVFVAVPVAHLAIFALYTFRVYLHSRLNSASYSTTQATSPRDTNGAREHLGNTGQGVEDRDSIEMNAHVNPAYVT